MFVQLVTPFGEDCHWYEIPVPKVKFAEESVKLAFGQPPVDEILAVLAFGIPEQFTAAATWIQ